ncbi:MULTISPECIES: hypothetical protein [unclassified Pseudoalteromonas]|uniref:hypothetical protein n=1 Tax=unclassified Pseudoalteromonas TaxID=194690 RepID=UPI00301459E0
MNHCNAPIYINESYCGHCGETLPEEIKLTSVAELLPEVIKNIKGYYPDFQSITGTVLSTYLYKRRYTNGNNDLTYSYWWVELEDREGLRYHTSVSAEDEFFRDIKRGDVLTLVQPAPYSLNYPVVGKQAQTTVNNSSSPGAVINHMEEMQKYQLQSAFQPEPQSTSFLWLLLSGIMFFCLYGTGLLAPQLAAILSAVCAVGVYLFESNSRKKSYQKRVEKYNALVDSLSQMLQVSRDELGYHLAHRSVAESDIFCFSCHKRIPDTLSFCPGCGESIANSRDAGNAKELEQKLMEQFSMAYDEPYVHRNALYSNSKGDVLCRMFLGRVVAKPLDANVSDVETLTTTTIRTDHYRGGYFNHSSYETETERHRQRDSNISGQLMVQIAGDEIAEFTFAEDVIGVCDIGDWVVFAYATPQLNHDSRLCREYIYNISKEQHCSTNSFIHHSFTASLGVWFTLAVVALVSNFVLTLPDYAGLLNTLYHPILDPVYQVPWIIENVPLAVFALLSAIWAVQGSIYIVTNKRKRKKILAPLRAKLNKFEQSIEEVITTIKKLN